MKGKTMITDAIIVVKKMNLPGTRALCWVRNKEDENHFGEDYCYFGEAYCYDCAEEMCEQSKGLTLVICVFPTTDSSKMCGKCGVMLDVILSEDGILNEIEHFENLGITTLHDWRRFLDILENLSYVENKVFPFSSLKEKVMLREKELRKRAFELYVKEIK